LKNFRNGPCPCLHSSFNGISMDRIQKVEKKLNLE
jgi:hypothetical protein